MSDESYIHHSSFITHHFETGATTGGNSASSWPRPPSGLRVSSKHPATHVFPSARVTTATQFSPFWVSPKTFLYVALNANAQASPDTLLSRGNSASSARDTNSTSVSPRSAR